MGTDSPVAVRSATSHESLDSLSLPELASRANDAANDCEQFASAAVESAMRCGMALVAAKAKVQHGQWLVWLGENFCKSHGQAKRYMSLARGAHARHLDDAASIRDALRRIAGPRVGTTQHRDEEIAKRLRAGYTQKQVITELHCQPSTVKRIYETVVVPELLEVDWRANVNRALVKEIAMAKDWAAIEAEHRSKAIGGRSNDWAADEANVTIARLTSAKSILKHGCKELISRCEDGAMALTTARDLAQLPHESQQVALQTIDRKQVTDVVDDLRSRVSLMSDQRLGWCHEYGTGNEVFRGLRDSADEAEIAEIISNLKLVLAWVRTIARELGDDGCLPQTNGQRTS